MGSVLESLVSSDVEIRKFEIDFELRKVDAQKERELRELEFQEQERGAQIEKQRLDHELEMRRLELQEKSGSSHCVTSSVSNFDVSSFPTT